MASELDLVNDALLTLGEPTILALDANMDVARTCNGLYPQARDHVLAMHPWNGCVTQIALTRKLGTPLMTFDYVYLYPSDCLRLLLPDEDRDNWNIGADRITHEKLVWANYLDPIVEYIYRNTVVEMYPPWLREAISAWLAYKLTYPLTDHSSKRQAMQENFLFVLGQSKMLDGQEQSPMVVWATTLTDDVRRGGG